jgi:CRP/FNR family transcriptional regulator
MIGSLPGLLTEELRAAASEVALARGGMLFRVGEPVEHIYFVIQGELLAVRYLPDGTEAVMQRARAGEFFAQSAMAVQRFNCDARAGDACAVARLPVREVTDALRVDGAFALAFAVQLAGDLRRQCTRVERLRIKRARDRVLHYLVCEGPLVLPGRKLQDWARELGLEPETLYRTLADLQACRELERDEASIRLVMTPAAESVPTMCAPGLLSPRA